MGRPGESKFDKHLRAAARGRRLREILRRELEAGPRLAVELMPAVTAANASLSEVALQLKRLVEEGEASGRAGGPYSLRQDPPADGTSMGETGFEPV